MDAKEYQVLAARTLIDNPGEFTHQELMTIWGVIGLTGEAGEVAEMVKKGIFHRHGLERSELVKELGDVLWYISAICTVQGIDLGEVMQANIDKLRLRYPGGFSTADSVARVDTSPLLALLRADQPPLFDTKPTMYWKCPDGHSNIETRTRCWICGSQIRSELFPEPLKVNTDK